MDFVIQLNPGDEVAGVLVRTASGRTEFRFPDTGHIVGAARGKRMGITVDRYSVEVHPEGESDEERLLWALDIISRQPEEVLECISDTALIYMPPGVEFPVYILLKDLQKFGLVELEQAHQALSHTDTILKMDPLAINALNGHAVSPKYAAIAQAAEATYGVWRTARERAMRRRGLEYLK